jgi:NADPH-dependent curcumin reductase CurA
MADKQNQEVIFASKPKEKPTEDNFKLQDCPYPQLSADGEVRSAPGLATIVWLTTNTAGHVQVLVKILYLSVDPYMRPKVRPRRA